MPTMKMNSPSFSANSSANGKSPRSAPGLRGQLDNRNVYILAAALACALLPLEISHLLSVRIGALAYYFLQAMQPRVSRKPAATRKCMGDERTSQASSRTKTSTKDKQDETAQLRSSTSHTFTTKPTVNPVAAPTFAAVGFESEVVELINEITATPQSDQVMQQIAARVKGVIARICPEADVTGFASANFLSGAAFGVAVPEVDLIVSLSPNLMEQRFQAPGQQGNRTTSPADMRKLHKSAIRACTDQLVATGQFKFRRSAFRGAEPKVTLIAKTKIGAAETNVPINVCVNAVSPMHSVALITECGQKDPRAKSLILLVRRWAKDRGISHVAKGHLSPYAWALLTIYFLQVDSADEGPLLPALAAFESCSALTKVAPWRRPRKKQSAVLPAEPNEGGERRSVAQLFQDFIHFYVETFDWERECVSVRMGARASPDATFPMHVLLRDDGRGNCFAPSVEDPFEAQRNLGDGMTVESLARLHEEFQRAHEICNRRSSLTVLLEPWVPPEVARGECEN